MQEIFYPCKNAGVTTGALYFFFQDKADLYASLVKDTVVSNFVFYEVRSQSDKRLVVEESEVNNVSDMLIQTQNLGKTTLGELSSSMGKIIPTANAYGVSLDQLYSEEWVAYTKETFNGASSVIKYLGNYTHRIAISNKRIVSMDEESVTFMAKDYAKNGKYEPMTIAGI